MSNKFKEIIHSIRTIVDGPEMELYGPPPVCERPEDGWDNWDDFEIELENDNSLSEKVREYELQEGTKVRLKNGQTCTVKKELARNGQGIVYAIDIGGKDYAMKWYNVSHIINSNEFYTNLENKVNNGAPASNFVWPLAITERQNGSYGYVMCLRPQGYAHMSEFLLCHARFGSMQAQLNACLQVSMAFQNLHSQGLCFHSFHDDVFSIHPDTGEVLVNYEEEIYLFDVVSAVSDILGNARYIAPEIVEGQATPNEMTDYHALAICLFRLIYLNDPFDGAGSGSILDWGDGVISPVFIMDPTDTSNRPVKGIHNNVIRRWPIYPALLANAFCKTFSKEAIHDPTKRLTDRQWFNILLQVRSMWMKCPNCGKNTFIDIQRPDYPCVWCGNKFPSFNLLKAGRFTIPLIEGQMLYDCQLSVNEDVSLVAGEVLAKDGQLGIRNHSSYTWKVSLPDGNVKSVAPGSGMPIRGGLKIKFGDSTEYAEIL